MEVTTITATELARNMSDVLSRVRYRRETFRVERNGAVVAILEPPAEVASVSTWGEFIELLRSLPRPDEKFADDLEQIHWSQGALPPSPWES